MSEKELSLEEKIAEWIDTSVIVDCIVDALQENDVNVTLKNAKDLWLSHLEQLTADLKETCLSLRQDI
jgi:hypothetical protein